MPAKIMGILNVTPDSHYPESRQNNFEKALQHALSMTLQGADIIDVGGESTRPNAEVVSIDEELQRVIPVIKALREKSDVVISIDTMKPEVAKKAVEAGATFLNDVTGFTNPKMRELAIETGLPICVMHMQGTPQTMQNNPYYPEGIIIEMLRWFENQIKILIDEGVKEDQIIIDPGIGFGKTVADNLEIIHNLPKLKVMGFPLLVGLSRKSFMSKLLNKPPSELQSATLVMNTAAILNGADIIRVYDVKEHKEAAVLLSDLISKSVRR